ncbi:MAG: response regulator, partial [Bacillota bacterium]|nr:response regulator [Bacillota bacterium]
LNVREIKKAGFTADHHRVTNEKAMEQALRERKWDIILSGNSIPNFDALQALDVRKRTGLRIPFILISEDVPKEDIEKAMKNGCSAYVSKENLKDLRKLVIDIL